jgi:hypothetical protein
MKSKFDSSFKKKNFISDSMMSSVIGLVVTTSLIGGYISLRRHEIENKKRWQEIHHQEMITKAKIQDHFDQNISKHRSDIIKEMSKIGYAISQVHEGTSMSDSTFGGSKVLDSPDYTVYINNYNTNRVLDLTIAYVKMKQ